jgi:hypothetical protein
MQTFRYFVCLAAIALLGFTPASAWSQDSPGRFEAGGSFNATHLGPEAFGPGAEGDVNFGQHIALDSAYSWYHTLHTTTALFGAKVGTRTQHFGFFGKARPGLISIGDTLRDITFIFGPDGSITPSFRRARENEKALDLGGVFEYYPSRHWALRWDAGDLMIFQEAGPTFNVVGNVPPGFVINSFPGHTTHNFLFSTALHYRF